MCETQQIYNIQHRIQFGFHAVNFSVRSKHKNSIHILLYLYLYLYWIHLLFRIIKWLTGLLTWILCKEQALIFCCLAAKKTMTLCMQIIIADTPIFNKISPMKHEACCLLLRSQISLPGRFTNKQTKQLWK